MNGSKSKIDDILKFMNGEEYSTNQVGKWYLSLSPISVRPTEGASRHAGKTCTQSCYGVWDLREIKLILILKLMITPLSFLSWKLQGLADLKEVEKNYKLASCLPELFLITH